MSIKTAIREKGFSSGDIVSPSVFYLAIGGFLAWSFLVMLAALSYTAAWRPGGIELILVGFGLPMFGILLCSTNNLAINFIGLNFIAGGLGAVMGPVVSLYAAINPAIVDRALYFTILVSLAMSLSGSLFPNFYRHIGGILFGTLFALCIASIARLFIPALAGVGIIDYIGVALFSLYIGYDIWVAGEAPKTLRSALLVAISLYLDIANLFLHLLRIFAESEGD